MTPGKYRVYVAALQIRALALSGWGVDALAEESGMDAESVRALREGTRKYIHYRTAERVNRMFWKLLDTPSTVPGAPLVIAYARRRGWESSISSLKLLGVV